MYAHVNQEVTHYAIHRQYKAVLDAVSATLSVLKSPTVLRLEDGTFYGWEGVSEQAGSCIRFDAVTVTKELRFEI